MKKHRSRVANLWNPIRRLKHATFVALTGLKIAVRPDVRANQACGADAKPSNSKLSRRTFLSSAAVGAAVTVADRSVKGEQGPVVPFQAAGVQQLDPLVEIEVNCGFKERTTSDSVHLAYGHRIRQRLQRRVLLSLDAARQQGYAAQLNAAEAVLQQVVEQVDPSRLRELWLTVSGSVNSLYRGREYVIELQQREEGHV